MVFENAGEQEGLQKWRIEDFTPVEHPAKEAAQLHVGDSYIFLHTKDNGGRMVWTIHFWLGKETTQDESGAAAMLAVQLDDQLGGVPCQYRETQGNESARFLSYFGKGLRYLPGGVKSGFVHFDPEDVTPRMFKVKGKRNVRVEQVEVSIDAMNKSDCFILDGGKGKAILVFMPPGARRMEKFRATQVANEIRDEDHAGDSEVIIVDEYSDNLDMFFTELGGGSMDDVAETDGLDDEDADTNATREVKLYAVEDGSEVAGPLNQELLDSAGIYLLTGNKAEVYLWIGKDADSEKKSSSMKSAEQLLASLSLPSTSRIVRIPEGLETAIFKQLFAAWNEVDEDGGYTDSRIAGWKISDLHTENRKRIEAAAGAAPGFLPDDGSGEKTIWRIEDMEMVEVGEPNFLFGGDSYVILYKYDAGAIVYFWQGLKSTTDERASSAIHAAELDNNQLGGSAIQVRVVQGREPRHFLNMFGGNLVVFAGGKASGFKNVQDRDEYDEDGTRLFRVRSLSSDGKDARAVQVEEAFSSLSSEDVFVLETPSMAVLWKGKDSSGEEQEAGKKFAAVLIPNRDIQEVDEGSEDEDFCAALGGRTDYTAPVNRVNLAPRLFHLQTRRFGRSRAIEIFNFKLQDLVEDDVMILDTGREIYVWIGEDSTSEEKETAMKMAVDYLEADPSYRNTDNTVILKCRQGHEPDHFKSFFN